MFESTKNRKLLSTASLWILVLIGSIFAHIPSANAALPTPPVISTATITGTTGKVVFSRPVVLDALITETATAVPLVGVQIACSPTIDLTTDTSTASLSCPGLTPSMSYTFIVYATNLSGQVASAPSAPVTAPASITPPPPPPPTVIAPGTPAAPSAYSTITGTAVINVATPPTGGIPTFFIVQGSPNGSCQINGASGSCTISGLSTGASYSFTVTAFNNAGNSGPSPYSTPITVGGTQVPGTPQAPTVVVGNAQATVYVSQASSGGTPTFYTVNSNPSGHTCTITAPANSCLLTGLTNGISYTFTTIAWNSAGGSGVSANSAGVIPNGLGTPSTPIAVGGNSQATISVSGLSSGSPATSWRITSSPGGLGCTVTGASGSCTVTGLTNGTAYTFTAVATTAAGQTAASTASNSVTPGAAPSIPAAPVAMAGNGQATVRITRLSNAGTNVSYTVTSTPGSFSCITGADNSCVITGLTNGTSYTFFVVATNSFGASPHSPNSAAISPVAPALPPAPTATQLAAVNAYSTLLPGQHVITQNDQALTLTGAASADKNSYVIQGSGWSISAGALTSASAVQALNSSGNISVPATGKLNIIGTGYKPNSTVYVYLFSTPTLLGASQTDSNGGFAHAFAIPTGIALGNHVLQVNGATALNQVRSVSLGFSVGASAPTPASTTPAAAAGSQKLSVKVAFASGRSTLSAVALAQIEAITSVLPDGAQNVLVTLTPHIGYATPTKAMRTVASARVKKLKSALIGAGITGPFVVGKAITTPGAGVKPSYVTVQVNWTAA